MGDPSAEHSSVDAQGICLPCAYTIETRAAAGGVTVLVLAGELDLAAAPALRETVGAARAGGARGLVLDMAEVRFVDSSALRELLRASTACEADGVPLVLGALQPAVARLLELTRTTDALALTPTVEQALERAAAG